MSGSVKGIESTRRTIDSLWRGYEKSSGDERKEIAREIEEQYEHLRWLREQQSAG